MLPPPGRRVRAEQDECDPKSDEDHDQEHEAEVDEVALRYLRGLLDHRTSFRGPFRSVASSRKSAPLATLRGDRQEKRLQDRPDPMLLLLALAIIAFAACFHLHWALGGRIGFSVSLPQRPDGTPVMAHRLPWWRPAAGAVALGLAALALILLGHAGHVALGLPPGLARGALLAAGAAFVARALVPNRYVGFFKSLRSTRWARFDTRLYSPLFLLLGLLLIASALGRAG